METRPFRYGSLLELKVGNELAKQMELDGTNICGEEMMKVV